MNLSPFIKYSRATILSSTILFMFDCSIIAFLCVMFQTNFLKELNENFSWEEFSLEINLQHEACNIVVRGLHLGAAVLL